jgi:hypothetical protein
MTLIERAAELWRGVWSVLRTRRDRAPIDSIAALEDFVSTRSAYIAQKTLYSYVKARMGIRYPAMFADANIVASLNIAKLRVFAGCLSDLTIYAVAKVMHDRPVGNDERCALARRMFEAGLRANTAEAAETFPAGEEIEAFESRLAATDWRKGALEADNFTASPRALYQWAPIADKLKAFDAEIVANSIRFAWRDVREQFQKRIVAEAVAADWARPGRT